MTARRDKDYAYHVTRTKARPHWPGDHADVPEDTPSGGMGYAILHGTVCSLRYDEGELTHVKLAFTPGESRWFDAGRVRWASAKHENRDVVDQVFEIKKCGVAASPISGVRMIVDRMGPGVVTTTNAQVESDGVTT